MRKPGRVTIIILFSFHIKRSLFGPRGRRCLSVDPDIELTCNCERNLVDFFGYSVVSNEEEFDSNFISPNGMININ